MKTLKIVALAGSTRNDSFNKKLAKLAARSAEEEGAEVTLVDLKDYPMPLYDGDLEQEQGLPQKAVELKELMVEADAVIYSSPEYNGSLTAVFKNTIDWLSRPGGPEHSPFRGKTALILSASPGGLGGLRGLRHLREILNNLGVLVIPDQHAVSGAHNVFGDNDEVTDPDLKPKVDGLVKNLLRTTDRLKS